jgi:hypothetical protein
LDEWRRTGIMVTSVRINKRGREKKKDIEI